MGKDVFTDYNKRKFLQTLAIAGCRLHLALGQTTAAADYFYRHYKEEDKEITLYVLLRTIEDGMEAFGNGMEGSPWLRLLASGLLSPPFLRPFQK